MFQILSLANTKLPRPPGPLFLDIKVVGRQPACNVVYLPPDPRAKEEQKAEGAPKWGSRPGHYRLAAEVWSDDPVGLASAMTALLRGWGYRVKAIQWEGQEGVEYPELSGAFDKGQPKVPEAVSTGSIENFLRGYLALCEAGAGAGARLIDPATLPEWLRVGPNREGKFAAVCGLRVDSDGLHLGGECMRGGPCSKTKSRRCGAFGRKVPDAVVAALIAAEAGEAGEAGKGAGGVGTAANGQPEAP